MKKCVYVLFVIMAAFFFNQPAAGRSFERASTNRFETKKSEFSESKFVDRFTTPPIQPLPNGNGIGLGLGPGGRPDPDTALGTVGDAIWLVALLGLAYSVAVFKKRRIENLVIAGLKDLSLRA
jgi:hypothetical protein